MTAVEKLRARLDRLPKEEQEAIATHLLAEWEAQQWDAQIAADAKAGKLDHLMQRAKARHRIGSDEARWLKRKKTYDSDVEDASARGNVMLVPIA